MVADELLPAISREPLDVGARWHSGAFVLETVPTALHLIAKYADDPAECLVRAVNDTWDNDTTAALCGAAMGALHGDAAFLPEWREGLLGRTGSDDDGHLFEVLGQLRRIGGTYPAERAR